MIWSNVKTLLTVFFGYKVIVHHSLCNSFQPRTRFPTSINYNILYISSPYDFFLSSKFKSHLKGTKISSCWGNPRECNKACYSPHPKKKKNGIPGILLSMEMMLDKVSGFQRGLISKEIKCRNDMCCSFLFIALDPIIFWIRPHIEKNSSQLEKSLQICFITKLSNLNKTWML